jgi:hypothetical protein
LHGGTSASASIETTTDRQRYLDRLACYREKFSFQFLAYCLMDNDVHLAI